MRVLLVSHCNFVGNSAMHVFSLAEELQLLGHAVCMLVPNNPETVERHRAPTFPIKTYDQALEEPLALFGGVLPDLIHAWSPREHVRKVTAALSERHKLPYVLHMEDNEEKIVSDEMSNLDFDDIAALPLAYQDALINPYRSHPTRYKIFAQNAAGYTCLIDRLLEFKPKDVSGVVFWPGFDPEFEHLPEVLPETRSSLGFLPDEKIVFYSGNVHESIKNDVRNLYLAIAILRARGRPIRLLRTGWTSASLDLPTDPMMVDSVVDLGFVDRDMMPTLLAISDILVQPGRSDRFNDYRFPSKLPEFLVSGKPVVLPDSNIGHQLGDEEEVLKLYDGTLAELLAAIERLLDSPDLTLRLGAASRQFALTNLRWAKAAERVSALYKQVLGSSPVFRASDPHDVVPEVAIPHPVNLIAFYLPQFHPIPENDQWWGKGFTEWTNVARAKPHVFGQRQPRVPTELGFYDLRVVETMHEQAKLAQQYGLGGFCFYAYWFDGRRLLERPLNLWRDSGPDFPFCICWANENWSRRWDGSETSILMRQEYIEGFEERFIIDMLPLLTDSRYIRVLGAPLLAIYRVSEFPNPRANVKALRIAAAKHGIPNLHIVMMQSFGLLDPRPYGCDAAIEFSPPHTDRRLLNPNIIEGVSPSFEGYLEDYIGVAASSINATPTDYIRYRGCFPMWDNTARRRERGHVIVNDSPKAYGTWLRFLVNEAMLRRDQVQPFIFINAWNEWAEGTYLEPDESYGRALLEVTYAALLNGVADFAEGKPSQERERQFALQVARLPKMT